MSRIIYTITTDNVQDVATDMFGKPLTDEQLHEIESKIADYFPLYDTLYNAISDILNLDIDEAEIIDEDD